MSADESGTMGNRPEKEPPRQQGGFEIRRSAGMVRDGWVYLLVDCSGSMAGDKLDQAKKGASAFAKDALAKGYSTGLIEFYGVANHLSDPTKELPLLQQHINGLTARKASRAQAFLSVFRRSIYGTNIAEAIRLAHDRLKSKEGARAIVIVTDGEPTAPGDPKTSLKAGEDAKNDGIDIITIGTGDADQQFLSKLASRTELGMKVAPEELQKTISSSANLLPSGR
jgi:Mg-chelatase subunit ChlD